MALWFLIFLLYSRENLHFSPPLYLDLDAHGLMMSLAAFHGGAPQGTGRSKDLCCGHWGSAQGGKDPRPSCKMQFVNYVLSKQKAPRENQSLEQAARLHTSLT